MVYRINVISPKKLVIVCEEMGVKLVQISTDYVSDGENSVARYEDNVTILQVFMESLGEGYVKTFCKKRFIVRTMLKLAGTNKEVSVVGGSIWLP